MDILRLNIEALSDGSIVLPGAVKVRHSVSDNLEERITEIIKASGVIDLTDKGRGKGRIESRGGEGGHRS